MFSTTRSATALALRGKLFFRFTTAAAPAKSTRVLTSPTAKPTAALFPRAVQAAYISSSSNKNAAAVESGGIVKGASGTPPPMKAVTGKPHREVLLPSQEGKQGAMQYALYVDSKEKKKKGRVQGDRMN